MPQALAAGVRKPPREETAIWARWPGRVGRHPQLWGFELWADAVRARCPSRGLYSLNPSRWEMNGMCSQGIRAASMCTSAGSRPWAKPSFGSPESQKLGSKNRATSMTSRQMKDSGLPASSKYRRTFSDSLYARARLNGNLELSRRIISFVTHDEQKSLRCMKSHGCVRVSHPLRPCDRVGHAASSNPGGQTLDALIKPVPIVSKSLDEIGMMKVDVVAEELTAHWMVAELVNASASAQMT
jgi:hypothetical protein